MKRTVLLFLLLGTLILTSHTNGYAQSIANTHAYELPKPVDLKADDYKKMIETQDVILLDIRTVNEFLAGHLEGAINIDWYQRSFEQNVLKLDKEKTILIYCRSGNRTSKAKYMMIGMGFKEIYNLNYGINDWARNNYKFVK